jgi:cellobiose-specific phosphotransferase system component IIC
MVLGALINFFIASVGAGAALLGLLFVSVSISPEEKISANASIEKRIGAYGALASLTNAFTISLVALIPGTFGIFVLIFSVATFAVTLQNGIELLQSHEGPGKLVRSLTLTLLSLFAYIAEGYSAVRLISNPRDSSPVYALATLLVIVYVLSVARAWELLGGMRRSPAHLLTTHLKNRTSSPGADENKKTGHHTRRD